MPRVYSNPGVEAAIAQIQQAAATKAAGADQAGKIIQEQIDKNIEYIKAQYSQADAFFAPYYEAGTRGLTELEALTGLKGTAEEQRAVTSILQSPTVQNAIQMGTDAYTKSAASQGGLKSGRIAQELQQFGQKTSYDAISQRQNQLYNIAQMGQQAAGQRANIATSLGESVSTQGNLGADARANAVMVGAEAYSNAQLAQAPLMQQLYSPLGFAQGGGGGQAAGLAGGAGGGMGGWFKENAMYDAYFQRQSNYMPDAGMSMGSNAAAANVATQYGLS